MLWANTHHEDVVMTVVAEAQHQTKTQEQAVVNVIFNRVRAGYGVNAYAVVSARNQFYGFVVRDKALNRALFPQYIYDRCDKLVTLAEQNNLPDITNGSLFFCQRYKFNSLKIGKQFFSQLF